MGLSDELNTLSSLSSDEKPLTNEDSPLVLDSLPDTSEFVSSEECAGTITDRACEICTKMIKDLSVPLKKLNPESEDFVKFKESIKEIKSALTNRKSKKAENLRENFSCLGMDDDELVIMKEFGDALCDTVEGLAFVDPMKEYDKENDVSYEDSKANILAKANISYGKFFINIHQRYGLSDNDMEKLVSTVFTNFDLYSSFEGRKYGNFPVGVITFVRAYMTLNSSMESKGKWRMPSVEEDAGSAIDLVREPENQEDPRIFYTIKTGKIGEDGRPIFLNIDLKEYWKGGFSDYVRGSFGPEKAAGVEDSVQRLNDYVNKERSSGEKVEGRLVLA